MRSCRGFSNEPIWTGPPPLGPPAILVWAALIAYVVALYFCYTHR